MDINQRGILVLVLVFCLTFVVCYLYDHRKEIARLIKELGW